MPIQLQSSKEGGRTDAQKEAVELASTYELCKDGCKCGKGGRRQLPREGAGARRRGRAALTRAAQNAV